MQFSIALSLLFFIIASNCRLISYAYQSGVFHFDSETSLMEAHIQHINSPIVLYGLIKIHSPSYFSFRSWHQKTDGYPNDTFTIFVEIGKINHFVLTIQYMILEAMPNLQTTCANFTWAKPSKIYHSIKNLTFNQNTFLTAYIVGFSSHQFAQDNYFFVLKGTSTYHLYTMKNLTSDNWLALRVIILQSTYQNHGIFCSGSHIDSFYQVSNHESFKKVEIHSDLNFVMGVEAIYQQPAMFQFFPSERRIQFSGVYSYSILAINTTCIQIDQIYHFSYAAKIYLAVTLVFIALMVLMFIGIFIYWLIAWSTIHDLKNQQNTLNTPSFQQKTEETQTLDSQRIEKVENKDQVQIEYVYQRSQPFVQIPDLL